MPADTYIEKEEKQMGRKVEVRVPASVANLGSGFDAMGMALNLYNIVELEEDGNEFLIEITGEGEQTLPRDQSNLVAQAINRLFTAASYRASGWRLRLTNRIPLQRGLGSSAAAIVGGLVAANAVAGYPLSLKQILSQAIALEGHPDNGAAALLGGVVLIMPEENAIIDKSGFASDYLYNNFKTPDDLVVYAVIPEFTLSTSLARSILPEQVPFRDAVFNLARAAMLAMALRDGDWDKLGTAMQDRIHQPYRAHLIPGLEEMLQAARLAGAYGAFLGGAGPSVIALGPPGSKAGEVMRKVFLAHGTEARVLDLQPSPFGACAEISAL
jgi:homoserine kinase